MRRALVRVENVRYRLGEKPHVEHDNEDRWFEINSRRSYQVVALFDGHDGPLAVDHVREYVNSRLKGTRSVTLTTLQGLFVETESNFFDSIRAYVEERQRLQNTIPLGMKSYQASQLYPREVARLEELEPLISGGCTAVVAVVCGNKLYVANVGDSRAVVVYQTPNGALETLQLSTDHDVKNEDELKRLEKLGLDPEELKRAGRLGPQENTRSIGDYNIKAGYQNVDVLRHASGPPGTAVPSVKMVDIDRSFLYLMVMSDGVYKSIEAALDEAQTIGANQVLANMVHTYAQTPGVEFSSIAQSTLDQVAHLHEEAFQRSAQQDARSPKATACPEIGLTILKKGGNAADAAVGVAAGLNVTEPFSTGIGGDCFCLFYEAATKRVRGINGRLPPIPPTSRQARAYGDCTRSGCRLGGHSGDPRLRKLSLFEILSPAITLAERGFPVGPIGSLEWRAGAGDLLASHNLHGRDLLVDGRAPLAGEVMKMPHLANTFRARQGRLLRGGGGQAIGDCVQGGGGVMTSADLKQHTSSHDQPIRASYRGVDVWEMPPSGQGITALMALNVLEEFDFTGVPHNSPQYLHILIEALRLSFADSLWYCADPAISSVPVEQLLSKQYGASRKNLIQPNKRLPQCQRGNPFQCSDTVYFCVADEEGNACSFINSNYMGFGTGLVPQGCGFTLQNRGHNFSLNPDHPNCLSPGKRPYHTIIPGMATHAASGDLYAAFGVMGGFMQPQGHVQVLLNMIDYGMDPQQALDAPRFCIDASPSSHSEGAVLLEDGMSALAVEELGVYGHSVKGPVLGYERRSFGRGQIICSRPTGVGSARRNVWWAGSDGRSDGMAIGY
eukprot:Em0020g500a